VKKKRGFVCLFVFTNCEKNKQEKAFPEIRAAAASVKTNEQQRRVWSNLRKHRTKLRAIK
jgi:hypothetical protein